MSIKAKKKNIPYVIHVIIVCLLMFGFGQIPPIAPLTEMGMKMLGVFFGLLYGVIACDLVWPSLLGLLAVVLNGYMDINSVLTASFGNNIVQMLFFIMVFCAVLDYHGVARYIAFWFITRKVVIGRPWLFTGMLLLGSAILSGLTVSVAACIVCWNILYSICDALGYKKTDSYSIMMIVGIAFCTQIGTSLVPFKSVPLAIFGAWQTMSGLTPNYGVYMILASLCTIISVLIFLLFARFLFKPDVTKLESLKLEDLNVENELKLNNVQKLLLVSLGLLIFMWIWPSFGPQNFILTKFLLILGNPGAIILIVAVLTILKFSKEPVLNFQEMESKGVMWGLMLLLAVIQPLSAAMSDSELGITAFLVQLLSPIISGNSEIIFIFAIGVAGVIITQFVTNVAIGVALMPVVFAYSVQYNFNGELAAFMVILAVMLAMMTPSSSGNAALCHGNKYMTDKKMLLSVCGINIIADLVVFFVIIAGLGMVLI